MGKMDFKTQDVLRRAQLLHQLFWNVPYQMIVLIFESGYRYSLQMYIFIVKKHWVCKMKTVITLLVGGIGTVADVTW